MSPSVTKAAMWMSGWLAAMLVMAVAGRENPRTRCLPDHGATLAHRPLDALSANQAERRLCHAEDRPSLAAHRPQHRPQHRPLRRPVRLADGAHVDTARAGHRHRVHHADLDGDPSRPFLGERMGLWKNLAVVPGLVGVAIIVRPFSGEVSGGQLIALAAALGFATSVIMVKALTRTERAAVILFWMMIIQSAMGLVPALAVWRWPSAYAWAWIVVIAFCGTYSHYCMTRALLHADATVVVPMDFLRVPLAALTGWLVYAERIDLFTALGAALILGGNMLNLKGAAKK